MNKIELVNERLRLQTVLWDYERDPDFGQQGVLDRVFAEDRKRHLLSRIAYMDDKIARLSV